MSTPADRLRHPSPRVRLGAVLALAESMPAADLARLLLTDPSAGVRRAAARALGRIPGEPGWAVIDALADPVWRVRDAAAKALAARVRRDPAELPELWRRLDARPNPCPRFTGAAYALRIRLGHPHPGPVPPPPPEPWRAAAWWDDDPAVLEQNLLRLGDGELAGDLGTLAGLLTLQDSRQVRPTLARIREFVAAAFARLAGPADLDGLRAMLADPRHPTAARDAEAILVGVSGREVAGGSEDGRRPPGHWPRVFFPPLPHVAAPRALGRTGLTVSALGVSGRYGLPERGFEVAVEAGVNLFFWEPEYHAQTRFWRLMPPGQRRRLVVVAGSFAATAGDLRRDLDAARRALGVEQLGVFLAYWVRSPARLSAEVTDTLAGFRESGAARAVGISTHQRTAAEAAVLDGCDVVMLRHNYVHRGAEARVLPLAAERGTGVLVFSATCHGRAVTGDVPAADCYRYALSQPGVSACWTAPRDVTELRENLAVLAAPTLSPGRAADLARRGDAAYPEHRAFLDGIRGR